MSFLNTLPQSTNLLHLFNEVPHTRKPLLEFLRYARQLPRGLSGVMKADAEAVLAARWDGDTAL